MQHLSAETYNNEQVSKVLIQNFSWDMLKMYYFASKSPNLVNPQISNGWEIHTQPPFRFNMQRSYSHWTFLVDANAWQFWGKRKLYFMFSGSTPSLSKNRFRDTEEADIYRRYKQIQL